MCEFGKKFFDPKAEQISTKQFSNCHTRTCGKNLWVGPEWALLLLSTHPPNHPSTRPPILKYLGNLPQPKPNPYTTPTQLRRNHNQTQPQHYLNPTQSQPNPKPTQLECGTANPACCLLLSLVISFCLFLFL